jgi:cytochrome c-type protein NapB
MFFSFLNDFNGGIDMKKIIFPLFLLLIFVFACTKQYQSLRGDNEITAGSNPAVGMDWQPDDSVKQRSFALQPPLIPHDISEYEVNTDENACLECHADPDSDAPELSKTHFKDREGKAHDEVSSLRYFCLQCHVGQVKAEPLVENTFKGQ